MALRHAGACLVLVGIVGLADPGPRAASANRDVPAKTALNLRLTASKDLPGVSRTALVREAESIWRDAQVTLRWLDGGDTSDDGRSLRVLVTPRAVKTGADGHRLPVGELLRFDDSSAIAMASITAALRIVQGNPDSRLVDLSAMRQYTLGVVLGRAVAHEIGHYLLQSNAHAPYGLMRASIDAREFADLRTGAFRLDRESQAYLAALTSS